MQERLQKEVDEAQGAHDSAHPLPYIEAVINETLRLKPVVPSGQSRVTPPEGLFIDETWIPGNTIVVVPQYLLQRDARNFAHPLEFLPERWLEEGKELILDDRAFFPFTIGKIPNLSLQAAVLICTSRALRVCRQATGIFTTPYGPAANSKGVQYLTRSWGRWEKLQ